VTSPHDRYRQDFVESAEFLFFSAANYKDPGPLIRSFLAVQPQLVIVVGLGARGCALGTRERIAVFPPVNMDTSVVDTNGAGDALAVGFLSSHVLDGYSLHDSILRGQIAARHACTLKASTSNLIGPEQLDQVFEELARSGS
jgi:sugar/nucleoside kinase (ribokinase family)